MALTNHAVQQLRERLSYHEWSLVSDRLIRLETMYQPGTGSVACKILILEGQRNPRWGAVSNGDTVVAVLRDGKIVTVMLRRSTQPFCTKSFDVDRVFSMV